MIFQKITGQRNLANVIRERGNVVLAVWKRSSIPHNDDLANITRRISNLRKEGQQLLKIPTKRRSAASFKRQFNNFNCKLSLLFGIAFCKCTDILKCVCEPRKRVPVQEIPFLRDQRQNRQLNIGRLDIKHKKRLKNVCASKSSSDKIHKRTPM